MRVVVRLSVAVIALMSVLTAPASADPVVENNVRIPLSDGLAVVGDTHRPAAEGAFPVILNMTPYGPATYNTAYLSEGYAHVNVDIRGTGRSDGSFCVFCDREQQDVYEVVEWVAAQLWSDGNVGMTGGSYQGITPLLGAAKQPPHLKAIVPIVSYADPYRDIVWHNGMFNYNFVAQWTGLQTALSATGAAPNPNYTQRADTWLALRSREQPFDDARWREMAVYTKYDRITVPTLLIGGWFDGFTRGMVWNFQGIAAEHKRLVMYPMTHKGNPGGEFDPLSPYTDVPEPSAPDPVLAWFDRFLKGIDNGVDREAPMTYYDLGSRGWKTAGSWPPAGAELRSLHLSGDPSGSATSVNDGSLTTSAPAGAATASDSYSYNPATGVTETFAKWGTVAGTPHVRLDQRPDEASSLTYTTEAQSTPLPLAGPMELRMWAQTDASDTDWVVKVTDVAPDGTSTLITSGYMRASHREVDEARSRPAEPWIANERKLAVPKWSPVEYRIDVWPISHTVMPGHRLRMTVMSSDATNHEPLPEPARNTVFHDQRYPSRLIVTLAA